MAASKKAKNDNSSHSLTNATKIKGTNFYRDAQQVRRLNVIKGGKPIRNSMGKIIKAAEYQTKLPSGTRARVEPNRRWFENSRVTSQQQLQNFREALEVTNADPYSFVLRSKHLPLGLVQESKKGYCSGNF